jgi:hypothetical protein
MQMDAYLKKEQIGTLFVLVGAPEGRFKGRGGGGSGPKIIRAYQIFISGASCTFNSNIIIYEKYYIITHTIHKHISI